MQSNIPNLSVEVIHSLFPILPLHISDFVLIQRGKCNGANISCSFKIVSFENQLFSGKHTILFEEKIIKVNSLSSMKRKVFHFDDKLAFERCTFVDVNNQLIRIKSIRHLFQNTHYVENDYLREEARLKKEMYNFQLKAQSLGKTICYSEWEKEFQLTKEDKKNEDEYNVFLMIDSQTDEENGGEDIKANSTEFESEDLEDPFPHNAF